EIGTDGVQRTDPPANLDGDRNRFEDRFDLGKVTRAPLNGAIEIHYVQKLRALPLPLLRDRDRVVGIHRLLLHVTLTQPDTATILEVYGRDDEHLTTTQCGRPENGNFLMRRSTPYSASSSAVTNSPPC